MQFQIESISTYYCLVAVILICSVGAFISSLEIIVLRDHYKRDGMFSWEIHRLLGSARINSRLLPAFDAVFSYPAVIYVTGLRALSSIGVFLCFTHKEIFASLVTLLAITSVMYTVRGPDGRSGADQMTKIIFVSASLSLISTREFVWKAEVLFLVAQLTLSYLTSGILKVREAVWRKGEALSLIFRQQNYGNWVIWRAVTNNPRLTHLLTWSVLSFECAFPVVFFLPLTLAMLFLAVGVAFHMANAAVMGLNTFVWPYLSLYLPTLWIVLQIHRYL
jgi:hypothetical protein